tara:strand:- start:524 stop:775 length:252 start_codon:yes stop_codon:yes gene_type:complete
MRTVFREATILGREPDGPLDIVVDDGRIADIGKTIAAAGEEIRLGGKLATPGMVETRSISTRPAFWTAVRPNRRQVRPNMPPG